MKKNRLHGICFIRNINDILWIEHNLASTENLFIKSDRLVRN